MKILSILARNYEKLDFELFPYCTANHTWFLCGTLHRVEMAQERVFITADFKLEPAQMFLRNFC